MRNLSERTRCVVALALTLTVSSQWAYGFSGTEGASFLDIPVGARPAALGAAYSALAADAYAPIYNPGGLGLLRTTQLSGMHIAYLESTNYEYATFVHPFSIGNSIGLSVQYLNLGRTAARNDIGTVTGDFTGYDAAYSLSYGHHIGSNLGIGITGKFIQSRIDTNTAQAFAGDAGMLYRVDSDFSLAAVATNIGSKLKFIEQKDSLPQAFHLALGHSLTRYAIVTLEGVREETGFLSARGGLEWNPLDVLSLRAGFRTDTIRALSAMAGFTTGVGLHLFGQEFDYAWVPVGELGSTHYFSIVLRFTRAERAKRDLIYYNSPERQNVNEDEPVYDPPLSVLPSVDLSAQQAALLGR